MPVTLPVADRIQALRNNVEEASNKVNSWSPAKRESADVTIQTRSLASYYESVICSNPK